MKTTEVIPREDAIMFEMNFDLSIGGIHTAVIG